MILFSHFLPPHHFLFFLSFSFVCVIFKLIECKKTPAILHFFTQRAANITLIFKNWNSLGFMAKIKKKMALQFRETFICFTSFRNASQSSLRFVYAQKKKNPTREETLPSLSSSFRRPAFIGRVRSSLWAIFWKTKENCL